MILFTQRVVESRWDTDRAKELKIFLKFFPNEQIGAQEDLEVGKGIEERDLSIDFDIESQMVYKPSGTALLRSVHYDDVGILDRAGGRRFERDRATFEFEVAFAKKVDSIEGGFEIEIRFDAPLYGGVDVVSSFDEEKAFAIFVIARDFDAVLYPKGCYLDAFFRKEDPRGSGGVEGVVLESDGVVVDDELLFAPVSLDGEVAQRFRDIFDLLGCIG